ncbi:hypothetical protein M9Y10_033760 [Tritrichomonas musculus]|uniref:Cytohesin-1 n=1 Tax=Tritrichomonas musculus TaxID=1915356 RepID=A0ABR2KDQ1_9EUKA
MFLSSSISVPPSIEDEAQKEDTLLNAVFAFNAKPSEGIHELCLVHSVDETPENIAHILREENGLLGPKIASYLSSNIPMMYAYFDTFDMHNKSFIESMRMAFSDSSITVQGEGEFVDKVVSVFSEVYCQQNPNKFQPADAAYKLAYALILLNSDLHNPNLKIHMTCQQFVSNTRGVVNEETISDNELADIYKQIKSQPFTVRDKNDDFLALSDPRLKGILLKKNDRWSSKWTSRFFVLANSCLFYFDDNKPENKDKPLGMIQLIAVDVFNNPKNSKRFYIEVKDNNTEIQYVKYKSSGPILVRGVKKIEFEAPSEKARDKWLYRIAKSLICSLFAPGDPRKSNMSMGTEQSEISEVMISSDERGEAPSLLS